MESNTKRNIKVAASYAGALLLGIMLGNFYVSENRSNQITPILPITSAEKLYKVQNAVDLIVSRYVDSVHLDSLQETVIENLISELDPFSEYLPPQIAKARQQNLEGSFDGIGVEYFKLADTIMAVGLVPGGPAQKAGIKVGDRLIAIDGKSIVDSTIGDAELEKLLIGKRGSALELQIVRNGLQLPLPIKVIRDKMEISTLDAAYIIEPSIAYVRIRGFGAHTVSDFKREMDRLMTEGANKLILDLRGNRGGYFSSGIELANQFLEPHLPIVYAEGANYSRSGFFANEGGIFTKGEMIVLIDQESASASEIVAGALQDHERATIIGRNSFGKGLVQERFTFGDGAALHLTVARYYTPLGRGIQKRKDSVIKSDSLVIEEGFRTASGKLLFEGGGIKPDIEISLDSAEMNPIFQRVSQAGLLHEFVYSKLTNGLPSFSIENFLKGYYLTDQDYKAFLKFIQDEEDIVLRRSQQAELRELISSEIEALLGRYYFGSDAYYKIKNRKDKDVRTALVQFSQKTNQEVSE